MLIKQNKVFLLYQVHSIEKYTYQYGKSTYSSLHANTDLQLLNPHGFSYVIKVEIILT